MSVDWRKLFRCYCWFAFLALFVAFPSLMITVWCMRRRTHAKVALQTPPCPAITPFGPALGIAFPLTHKLNFTFAKVTRKWRVQILYDNEKQIVFLYFFFTLFRIHVRMTWVHFKNESCIYLRKLVFGSLILIRYLCEIINLPTSQCGTNPVHSMVLMDGKWDFKPESKIRWGNYFLVL